MRASGCCLMTLRCVCSRRRISWEPAPLRRSPHLHLTCCSTGGCSTRDTNMNSRTAVDSGGCSNQALWQLSPKAEDGFCFFLYWKNKQKNISAKSTMTDILAPELMMTLFTLETCTATVCSRFGPKAVQTSLTMPGQTNRDTLHAGKTWDIFGRMWLPPL